jgi:hypothetical protein
MVGESGTQSDYDEEWEKLLDSGILEDLIKKAEVENAVKQATQADFPDCEVLESLVQKAEQESAVKRATQVVPSFSTPQSRQVLAPPPNLLVDGHIPSLQPSCILSTSLPVANGAQIPGRAQVHSENTFNTRSQVLHGPSFAKPPLPFDPRGSQSYNQDRHESTHQLINLSQYPTQTPGSVRYNGTPANGAVSTPNQPPNGVSGLHRDGEISQLRTKLLKVRRATFRAEFCIFTFFVSPMLSKNMPHGRWVKHMVLFFTTENSSCWIKCWLFNGLVIGTSLGLC